MLRGTATRQRRGAARLGPAAVCISAFEMRQRPAPPASGGGQGLRVDQGAHLAPQKVDENERPLALRQALVKPEEALERALGDAHLEIGRTSCRERVCQYV